MYERIDNCPVCDHDQYTNFIICKDYSISQESFAIVQCTGCGFKFTNPRPSINNIDKYYQSEDYISHSNKGNSLINVIYKFVRYFTLRSKLNLLNKFTDKGNLLDIGCGTGDFLNICKRNGWRITGVEPDEKARLRAQEINDIIINKDIFEINKVKNYQAITLWHVLEHVNNLDQYIIHIKKLLNKKGKLIIAVPNANSYDSLYFKEYWAAYDLPRHFYHFTPETIKLLCKKHDLKLKKIIPLKLDSYYISLLSSKYKEGTKSFVKALSIGYSSNKWAKNNNNNYSSLIYIIKK